MEKLKEYRKRIDRVLEEFFSKKLKEVKKKEYREIIEALRDFTEGGKRIRAALLYQGYACFKEGNEEVIKLSAVMELLQSFLLIHDDIIDRDSLRRGKLTIHKRFEEEVESGKAISKEHFGISMALLVGDLASSFMIEFISKSNFDAETKIKAIAVLHAFLQKTIYGQVLDAHTQIRELPEEDLAEIVYLKTTSYTIEGPLHIGAVLAGANEEELVKLSKMAIPLGRAFQIQDDILGIYGDEKRLGKPIGSDIKEGKRTLLWNKAMKLSAEKDFLENVLGKNISLEDLQRTREIIKKCGALDFCKQIVKSSVEEGKEKIRQTKIREEAKSFLLEMAEFLENRDY